ncbi:MAG: hypothetical protein KatS3mg119_0540 [Rhodothalassiaceae bacterium]|nr:MAG: hypothetical protein KatS3mg119_0540 [Rhodothalassiaceae bacterium]
MKPTARPDPEWDAALGDLGAAPGGRRWWRDLVLCVIGLAALATVLPHFAPAPWRGVASAPPAEDAAEFIARAAADELAQPGVPDAAAPGPSARGDAAAPGDAAVAGPPSAAPAPRPVGRLAVLRRGEALVDLLRREGLSAADALALVGALRPHADPRRLPAGARFKLTFRPPGGGTADAPVLEALSYRLAPDRLLAVRRADDGFEAVVRAVPAATVTGFAAGRITDSLYVDAERAGVPVPIIAEAIRALGFAVDFEREIWPGDGFEILYTTMIAEDGLAEPGDVLFVGLTLRGRQLAYYRFAAEGRDDYFDARGESIRRTLMKTPLDGARLTSRFGRRRHPILGYVTAHKGVDFGAPSGTPVYAAGDGVVERAGRYGGYGNYVRIRHNATYATAYGHLKGFARGIRPGVRVHQGQVIGYVGATGRATGPHLHYEVLVNGRQVNPLTLELPSGRVLAGAERAAFARWRAEVDEMRAKLRHAEALRLAQDAGGSAVSAQAAERGD